MRPSIWRLDPNLIMLLLLAEMLAAAEGRGTAPRVAGRPGRDAGASTPRRKPQLARGTLSGRRPRG